jgi:hypothetical protein
MSAPQRSDEPHFGLHRGVFRQMSLGPFDIAQEGFGGRQPCLLRT